MNADELKWHITRLKKSKTDSFKAITALYHESIFRFLLFRVNDSAIAEDLLQETFIRLWENRHKLDESLSLQSYLFTTASNLSLNHFRHEKVVLRFRQEQMEYPAQPEDPGQQLEYKEMEHIILKTIDKMSDKVRMVFLLCKIERLSYKEIAERLAISVATVESHMVKALRMIREALHRYNPEGNHQGKNQ